jgi:hypothetical protein
VSDNVDQSRSTFSRMLHRVRTEWRKKRGAGHSKQEFNAAIAGRESVFRAPPLTPELVAAIHAISPQFSLQTDEASRELWQTNQNGSCWGEFDALEPLLRAIPRPNKVLEIGPGMGRSAVFLKKQLGWEDVLFHLYDSDGPKIKYPAMAPRSDSTFCGSLQSLRNVLAFNELSDYEVFDARELDSGLGQLPGPYDLIFSFYGVGFHWALEDFWTDILSLMHDDSVAVFTVHRKFREFPALRDLNFGYVTFQRVLAKDRPLRLLLVSRNAGLIG